jgi:hypothetical protein
MAGDDFHLGSPVHLFGSHIDFAGYHAVYLLESFQVGLPGMVFRADDLGVFLQKGYRIGMDDLPQIYLHFPSSTNFKIVFIPPPILLMNGKGSCRLSIIPKRGLSTRQAPPGASSWQEKKDPRF